ncbi:hypothetical protein MNBD_ACTINO02-2904 [hydrothermal vent metagenome]|uniref:Cell division initiation protein DivIVA n=1 Tax=hydrothermal vent metagenome TaxID=652676 RepID=A0A3B0TMQ9_9ZZZZ
MGAFSDLSVEFTVARRGYDTAEVDKFLDVQVRELASRFDEQATRLTTLEATIAEAREREEAIHLTLVAATKTKDELLASAEQSATETKAEAGAEAAKIIGAAKNEAAELLAIARADADSLAADATLQAETTITTAEERAANATRDVDAIFADAQTEADTTRANALTEAAVTLDTAKAEADSVLRVAREEAIGLLERAKAETAEVLAARESELALLKAEFDDVAHSTAARASQLKDATAALEAQLTAIANGALSEVTALAATMEAALPAEQLAAVLISSRQETPAAPIPTTPAFVPAEAGAPQPAYATASVATRPETSVPAAESTELESSHSIPTSEGPVTSHIEDVAEIEPGIEPVPTLEDAASVEAETTPVAEAETPAEIDTDRDHAETDQLKALIADVAAMSHDDAPEDGAAETDDSVAGAESDLEAAVEALATETETNGRPQRGSFYSRRSAKLPRIGAEAASNAVATVNAMRASARAANTEGGGDKGRAKQSA